MNPEPRRAPTPIRFPDEMDVRLRAHTAMTGETRNAFVVSAVAGALEHNQAIANAELVDSVLSDFLAVTLEVTPADDGASAARVIDDERRTTDPAGRPYHATKGPLEKLVAIKTRHEGDRTVVELAGLPGSHVEAARVFVAAVPTGARATVSIRISDLHPLSRPEAS